MNKKVLLLCLAIILGSSIQSFACTGISLTAKDGSYIQARTIEGAQIAPRQDDRSDASS